MRSDIDRLMAERDLDAAVALGSTATSPTMYYLAGGVSLEGVTVVLRRGQRPLLVHSPMERDDAVKTGMECVANTRWNLAAITREMGGALLDGKAEQLRRILADFDVRGRVGFYGHGEIGQAHALLTRLEQVLDDVEVVVEFDHDLISSARVTKDEQELASMLDVARRANDVVAAVADIVARNLMIEPNSAVAQSKLLMTQDYRQDIADWAASGIVGMNAEDVALARSYRYPVPPQILVRP